MNREELEFMAALLGENPNLPAFFACPKQVPFTFCRFCGMAADKVDRDAHITAHVRQFSPSLREAFMSSIALGANRYLAAREVLGMKNALEWQNFFRSDKAST